MDAARAGRIEAEGGIERERGGEEGVGGGRKGGREEGVGSIILGFHSYRKHHSRRQEFIVDKMWEVLQR